MDIEVVRHRHEVAENIHQYNRDLPTTTVLQDRLAMHRDWYYNPEDDQLGPSKFIGFLKMSGEKYQRYGDAGKKFDGGRTEKALAEFSKRIEDNHPDYRHLRDKLNKLLGTYDKKPRANFTLNVLFLT